MSKDKEEVRKQRTAARVVIADSRARMKGPMEEFNKFGASKAWHYGYLGGTMGVLSTACIVVGGKYPYVRTYGVLPALGLGYMGGNFLYAQHALLLKKKVVGAIDANAEVLEAKYEEWGETVPEYGTELRTMQKLKSELSPPSAEELAQGAGVAGNVGLDERVDNIVAAFERRKKSRS